MCLLGDFIVPGCQWGARKPEGRRQKEVVANCESVNSSMQVSRGTAAFGIQIPYPFL